MDSAPTLEKLLHLPEELAGEIPDPRTRFPGCRFAGRCPNAKPFCVENDPRATPEGPRTFYCHYPHAAGVVPVREVAGDPE